MGFLSAKGRRKGGLLFSLALGQTWNCSSLFRCYFKLARESINALESMSNNLSALIIFKAARIVDNLSLAGVAQRQSS